VSSKTVELKIWRDGYKKGLSDGGKLASVKAFYLAQMREINRLKTPGRKVSLFEESRSRLLFSAALDALTGVGPNSPLVKNGNPNCRALAKAIIKNKADYDLESRFLLSEDRLTRLLSSWSPALKMMIADPQCGQRKKTVRPVIKKCSAKQNKKP